MSTEVILFLRVKSSQELMLNFIVKTSGSDSIGFFVIMLDADIREMLRLITFSHVNSLNSECGCPGTANGFNKPYSFATSKYMPLERVPRICYWVVTSW